MRSVPSRVIGALVVAVSVFAVPGPAAATGDEVKATGVGIQHSCAIRTDGSAWCWGADDFHQLGDGATDAQPTPVRVEASGGGFLGGAQRISPTSTDHTCIVRGNGTARCWGKNFSGQLGAGTSDEQPFPVTVTVLATGQPLTKVSAVGIGDDHTCALRTDHTVWCWGNNGSGRLGDGTQDPRSAAVQVVAGSGHLTGAVGISVGSFHSCAVLADTTVRCWGANFRGELGDGTKQDRLKPVAVKLANGHKLTGVVALAAGFLHTCALLTNHTVRCWGANDFGNLGDGTSHERLHPVTVMSGTGVLGDVRQITAGADDTCAVTGVGSLYCWGNNKEGQIGDGTLKTRRLARLVRVQGGPFAGVRSASMGAAHVCAVKTDRTLWCWGSNDVGQVGNGLPNGVEKFPVHVAFP